MRAAVLDEPELEFGGGSDVDVRRGLAHLGPLDVGTPSAPGTIRLGLVGPQENLEGATAWLKRCRSPIRAKESRLTNLFPPFPGFHPAVAFRSEIALSPMMSRRLPSARVVEALSGNLDADVDALVDMFLNEIDTLLDSCSPGVIAVCVPPQLVELRERQAEQFRSSGGRDRPRDFHDLLKARALERFSVPLQLLLPSAYGGRMPRRRRGRRGGKRSLQDEATRAWNLHAALYYKAGGRPWKVQREPTDLATCFVGISFPFAPSTALRFASLAQVFDERGDGIIVRGTGVQESKDDRTPHLERDAARSIMAEALERYYETHRQYPARVVVHKTSVHDDQELAGFREALAKRRIEGGDFLSFGSRTQAKLFRLGKYPPMRGTMLQLDEQQFLLYTRGSVPFFRTYPGQYVPQPLPFRIDSAESTPRQIASDLLALTKLNWNDTQFDHRKPVTLSAAIRVGKILRYVSAEHLASRYSFFM